jgi:hypothetical protein
MAWHLLVNEQASWLLGRPVDVSGFVIPAQAGIQPV